MLSHLSIATAGNRLVNRPPGPARVLRRVIPEGRTRTTRIRSFALKPVPWTATGCVSTSSSSASFCTASGPAAGLTPAIAVTAARAITVPRHLFIAGCPTAAPTSYGSGMGIERMYEFWSFATSAFGAEAVHRLGGSVTCPAESRHTNRLGSRVSDQIG
jgi:hypothetical protein